MRIAKVLVVVLLVGLLAFGAVLLLSCVGNQEVVLAFYMPENEHSYFVKNYKNGSYCDEPFRVITFTDTHFTGSMDTASDRASLALLENTIIQKKPDLIVLCGDIVLGAGAKQGAFALGQLFEKHSQYWAFVLGNHDGEYAQGPTRTELVEIYTGFQHCIISSTEGIWGDGNCIVNIKNGNNDIIQSLIFIDAGNRLISEFCDEYGFSYKDDYDFVKYDQIEWYKQEMMAIAEQNGSMPRSIMFLHIPLVEYKLAYDSAGEDEHHYGVRREAVSASPYNTGMFDAIIEVESTQAVVCGHDHNNDFCVEYKGVRLLYSQSSSFGSYYMRNHSMWRISYLIDKSNKFCDGHTEIVIKKNSEIDIVPHLNQDNPSLFQGLSEEDKKELFLDITLE